MNRLDTQYQELLQVILDYGVNKTDRTGTGTKSIFGYTIRHKMSDGFPLLTTKKMAWKSIVTELLWFLRGDTNIKYLVDNDCHIWDGDAFRNYEKKAVVGDVIDSHYEPATDKWHLYNKEEFINLIKKDDRFSKKWGELGHIYGRQWRSWAKRELMFRTDVVGEPQSLPEFFEVKVPIDQIANLISELKTNPDSRRLMVNAWNVGELDQMVLPPCHYGFQVYTRELSLEERLCIADEFNPLIREDCLTKTHHPDETEELKLQYRHEWLDSLGPNVVPQRRAISLMWNQRSVDTPLGLPFNIASYGLLLEIIAKMVNMVPDELIGNLGDCHIYTNQIEGVKEQIGRELTHIERIEKLFETNKDAKSLLSQEKPEVICSLLLDKLKVPKRTREPFELPKLSFMKMQIFFETMSNDLSLIKHLDTSDFVIENYQSHPVIKMPLSN